jgi:hypothetical protein
MVWVYDNPLSKKEEQAYHVLKKRFKNYDLAKETVKLLSLTAFLRSQNFNSARDVQHSAFFDKSKTKPIFSEKTAKLVLKGLHKKGGGESKYPFIDFTIKNNASYIVSYLPDIVEFPLRNIHDLLTRPILNIKENIPLVELALDAMHGVTETSVTTVEDAAEAVGGPVGAAIATPLVALVGAVASGISILEQDVGQAVAHIINVIPLFGSALGKLLTQTEHMVKSLENHPNVAAYVPLVNSYVNSKNSIAAGKRFSTQRNKYNKWKRTKRNKSARV